MKRLIGSLVVFVLGLAWLIRRAEKSGDDGQVPRQETGDSVERSEDIRIQEEDVFAPQIPPLFDQPVSGHVEAEALPAAHGYAAQLAHALDGEDDGQVPRKEAGDSVERGEDIPIQEEDVLAPQIQLLVDQPVSGHVEGEALPTAYGGAAHLAHALDGGDDGQVPRQEAGDSVERGEGIPIQEEDVLAPQILPLFDQPVSGHVEAEALPAAHGYAAQLAHALDGEDDGQVPRQEAGDSVERGEGIPIQEEDVLAPQIPPLFDQPVSGHVEAEALPAAHGYAAQLAHALDGEDDGQVPRQEAGDSVERGEDIPIQEEDVLAPQIPPLFDQPVSGHVEAEALPAAHGYAAQLAHALDGEDDGQVPRQEAGDSVQRGEGIPIQEEDVLAPQIPPLFDQPVSGHVEAEALPAAHGYAAQLAHALDGEDDGQVPRQEAGDSVERGEDIPIQEEDVIAPQIPPLFDQPVSGHVEAEALPAAHGGAAQLVHTVEGEPVLVGGEARSSGPGAPAPAIRLCGRELPLDEARVVYVIDTSASMGSQQQAFVDENGSQVKGYRLDRAKAELVISINGLTDEFAFDVVAFTSESRALWGSTKSATEANKGAATAWIMALQPTGATGTGPCVAWALQNYECMTYVLVTDGAPNCLDSSYSWANWLTHAGFIQANNKGATVHVVSISPTSVAMIAFGRRVSAQNGGGLFLTVGEDATAEPEPWEGPPEETEQ